MGVVGMIAGPAEPAAPVDGPDRQIGRSAILGIVLILGVSYAFNGMDRQVFPALLGPIRAEYGLSLSESGFLANAFTLNIALFGALSGWFMGRFGRKATLVSGLAAYSLFTAATPFATGLTDLTVYRAMTGAGEALHISAVYAMLGAYFGSRRGVFMGVNNAFFGAGAFLGPFLGARLFAQSGSWRMPFLAFGIAGIVAALTVAAAVPRRFAEAVDPEAVASRDRGASPQGVLNVNSILCLAAFALIGCSFFAYVALYTTYLRTELSYGRHRRRNDVRDVRDRCPDRTVGGVAKRAAEEARPAGSPAPPGSRWLPAVSLHLLHLGAGDGLLGLRLADQRVPLPAYDRPHAA